MTEAANLARYRHITTLGSGGMATVTLAEDTLLGRRVALKRLHATSDPRGLSRLRREALLGASVSHVNLVSIYDVVSSEDGDLVIVMEYVRGETMREALAREGKLPVAETLRILTGVAAGLDTIHKRGIVHRDVKPPNILLGTDGSVKLADLGIASVPDRTRITSSGAVLGSFRYMAPEQLADAPATPAIDVYALSAVAFEALSGQKARREPNPMALAHAISTQPPPDLREAWPEAPSAASELLTRGMARDPNQRPRSAAELVARLRAALAPERTSRVASPDRSPRPTQTAVTAPMPPLAERRTAAAPARAAAGAAVASGAAAVVARERPADGAAAPKQALGASATRREPPPRGGGPRATPPAPASARESRGRRWLPLAGLLAAATAVVVLAAILGSGGGSNPQRQSRSAASHHHPAATPTGGGGATASTPSSAGQSSSGSGSSSAGSGASATQTTAPAGNQTPVAAVETFYTLAASHQYAQAWALADPAFQAQLGGYPSFQGGQAEDRSITFNSASVLTQSSGAATVSIRTTSVRSTGIQHCSGTVDLRTSAGTSGWLLHLIHISCA